LHCPSNCHPDNSSLSLCLTHTISKFSCYPTKLTNVYQLDGAKTDLQMARFFGLEWVVQMQYYRSVFTSSWRLAFWNIFAMELFLHSVSISQCHRAPESPSHHSWYLFAPFNGLGLHSHVFRSIYICTLVFVAPLYEWNDRSYPFI
jgi:hypothetical protein